MKYLDSILFFQKHKNLIIVLIGCAILYHGKAPFEFYKKSKIFKYTEASILTSEIKTGKNDKDVIYLPYVKFLYIVENKSYESDNIAFKNPEFSSKEQSIDFLKRYPKASIHKVFYNPENPKNAYLDKSLTLRMMYQLLIGLLTTFVGFASFIVRKVLRRVLFGFAMLNGGFYIIWNSKEKVLKYISTGENFSIFNSVKLTSGFFILVLGLKYMKPVLSEINTFILFLKRKN